MRRYALYQVCSVTACTAHGMMVRSIGFTPLDAMHSSETRARMHRHGLQKPTAPNLVPCLDQHTAECMSGHMQMAHEQLVSSSQGLREQGRACPTELMRTLMLLHSYILVKTLVRMGDHQVRVVPIMLCITVIDCIWHHHPTCKR